MDFPTQTLLRTEDSVVYYNLGPVKSFRKQKKCGSQVNVTRIPSRTCGGPENEEARFPRTDLLKPMLWLPQLISVARFLASVRRTNEPWFAFIEYAAAGSGAGFIPGWNCL